MTNSSGDSPQDEAETPVAEEQRYAEEEARRREAETDLDVPIVSALKESTTSPVVPVRLTAGEIPRGAEVELLVKGRPLKPPGRR